MAYELTIEDIKTIALTKQAAENLSVSVDKLNDTIEKMSTRCERCRGEIDTKFEDISVLHAEERGITRGQAVGYGSIGTIMVAVVLALLEWASKRGGIP